MFGLFWFGMTIIPLLALWAVPISPYGVALILLCYFFFSASIVFSPRYWPVARNPGVFSGRYLRKWFILSAIGAIFCAILDSRAQGISLNTLAFHMIAAAATYRDLVSLGGYNPTIYGRLSESLAYVAAILGGLLFRSTRHKKRLILLSFAAGVFLALAQSTKWTLFALVAFFYAGVLASRISDGDMRLLGSVKWKKLLGTSALLFAIAAGSFMSRSLKDTSDTGIIGEQLLYYFASYSSGHLYAFSDWCAFSLGTQSEVGYSSERVTNGAYTLAPIYRTLGGTHVLQEGEDYYSYGSILTSNIYTMFRGLLQDFGLLGALAFMFVIGLASHWAFWYLAKHPRSPSGAVAVIISVGFIYCSFARSVFTWSSLYFSFAVLWLILTVNQYSSWKHRHWTAIT